MIIYLILQIKIANHYKKSNYERFAMGDMAGKVSYLLDKKLIQLEGLVSGKKIIMNIKNESNLCKILKESKDRYLFILKSSERRKSLLYN